MSGTIREWMRERVIIALAAGLTLLIQTSPAGLAQSPVAAAAYDFEQPMTMPPMMGEDMGSPSAASRADSIVRRTQRGNPQVGIRLASIPKMFGDLFVPAGQFVFGQSQLGQGRTEAIVTDVPIGGGIRRSKISENDNILPEDRVFFTYNHFHNALAVRDNLPGSTLALQTHVDQYTFGMERTYWDGLASFELRMPFFSSFDFSQPGVPDFAIDGGSVGNLALVSKYLLLTTDDVAIGAGVTFDFPTGSDVDIRTFDGVTTINNSAYHFLPFVGFISNLGEDGFLQFSCQADLAANGNRVVGAGTVGGEKYNEQNMLYIDLGLGRLLYEDAGAPRLRALTGMVELHYTTSMQNTDTVDLPTLAVPSMISNTVNRFDVLNMTGGLQAALGDATFLRVAAVVPLRQGEDNRFFDSELQVQVNRRY